MRIVWCVLVWFCSAFAHAQSYPEKPIRLIVPFAPAGNADTQARIVAQRVGQSLGQQVIVENRAGANGVIGSDVVAKAAPDGYTLLFTASGHAINPALYAKLPFDPLKDFAPIGLVGSTPLVLAVTGSLPARSVKELVAVARSRRGALSYASQGNGSPGHLAGALFNSINRITIVHVPYKATAQALTDLTTGEVQVMYPSMTTVLPQMKAGKVRGLAITSRERSALARELPTMREAGIPGYEASIWNGMLAPARTPQAVITKLNEHVAKALQATDVKEKLAALGVDASTSTSEEFGRFVAAELDKWTKVVREAGVRID